MPLEFKSELISEPLPSKYHKFSTAMILGYAQIPHLFAEIRCHKRFIYTNKDN
jgi:hypothetical protein